MHQWNERTKTLCKRVNLVQFKMAKAGFISLEGDSNCVGFMASHKVKMAVAGLSVQA